MAEIHLGGRDFAVTGFTFDQLQILGGIIAAMAGSPGQAFKAKRDLIRAALGNKITDDKFNALLVTFVEIDKAVTTILEVSGLIELGEALLGSAPG